MGVCYVTNPQGYVDECSESSIARNAFIPPCVMIEFRHDSDMRAMFRRLWGMDK
jgi:hypothetical protein